jgi:carbon storage regulator
MTRCRNALRKDVQRNRTEPIKEDNDTMLVLSRKVGERIRIGDDVTITVVRITGGGVRLGIEAPVELSIIREELHEELQRQEQAEKAKILGPSEADA